MRLAYEFTDNSKRVTLNVEDLKLSVKHHDDYADLLHEQFNA